jgi:hypothetical protein
MSRTRNPTHLESSQGKVLIKHQASEQAKRPFNIPLPTYPFVALIMHPLPESLVQIGADDSLVPCEAPTRLPSDSFGDGEASAREASEQAPSNETADDDSTTPTESSRAGKDGHLIQLLLLQVFYWLVYFMSQARRDTSDGNLAKGYRYSPLRPGSIRLLRVMPHQDKSADLQCQLFEYPLQSSDGTHLYEALSYVWGDPRQRHAISVDGHDLFVTTNLHAALLRLRDRFFERIVWIDAICINQDNNKEKENQIQYMAEIYSRANRVTVWLGEAEGDSERALETICRAAAETTSGETISGKTTSIETSSEALFDEPTTKAIRLLLQRSWFKRIWVR